MVSTTRSPQSQSERQTTSLAALAVTLLLVVLGLYLIDSLRLQARVQDCVLSGRIDCELPAMP